MTMCYESIGTSQPTARKAHRCFWCGESILKGEKHSKVAGKFEGEFQSIRLHNECSAASNVFHAKNPGEPVGECEFKRGLTESRLH